MSDLQSPDDLPPHSIETPSVCVAAKVGAADAVAAVGAPKMGFVAETTAFVKPEKAVVRPAMPADTENVSRVLARSYRALLAEDYEPALLREALPLISRARPSLMSCGT